ncbi:MAG: hypothetical protein Ct9H300mP14_08420 [Gammaproteobacteria bacterium]|nr:MAG: hypothetical protein Ct9H300mP14_08420 [Gammaproteobacteria bacterium]
MAGASTPALAIAVSTTGGLGSLGLAMHTPKVPASRLSEVSAAGASYNANFFVHSEPVDDPVRTAEISLLLAPYYLELGLGQVPEAVSVPSFTKKHLEAVLDLRPRW